MTTDKDNVDPDLLRQDIVDAVERALSNAHNDVARAYATLLAAAGILGKGAGRTGDQRIIDYINIQGDIEASMVRLGGDTGGNKVS